MSMRLHRSSSTAAPEPGRPQEGRKMKSWIRGVLTLALCAACTTPPPPPTHKVEMRKLTGNTVEFVPGDIQQLGYCLLYTISAKGVVRQLTMNRENRSVKC